MERAGVVRMPRCCHSVIREPGNGMFDAYLYTDESADGIGVIWELRFGDPQASEVSRRNRVVVQHKERARAETSEWHRMSAVRPRAG